MNYFIRCFYLEFKMQIIIRDVLRIVNYVSNSVSIWFLH